MKGIVLAGGSGTRLYPVTRGVSKQLLAVHDKPMIFYSMSVLMLANIRDIMLITTPHDLACYKRLFGDGSGYGVRLSYVVQDRPEGLAQAFVIGEDFIAGEAVCLVLGDNIFFGQNFSPLLQKAGSHRAGATIFGYQVHDPERFGVVEFDSNMRAVSIEEKPEHPRSNYAVTGLYFYDNDVVSIAKTVKYSARDELEISSINQVYLERGDLRVELLGRGFTWLDTGTHESLQEATHFVQAMERHQGFKIACLEEIAYSKGWISNAELLSAARLQGKTDYGRYLMDLAEKDTK